MMLFKKYTNYLLEKKEVEQDPHVSKRDGSQPKKYYKGLSKDKKTSRASHFEKHGKKSDSDPDAYKDAPGDKKAREKGKLKTSKHTEKYKKMYGEKSDPCWDTHIQKGMKKKGNRMVPNCVPREQTNEASSPEQQVQMSRLDQLVRMGLADKKELALLRRAVTKLRSGSDLAQNERGAAYDLLTTLLDMVLSTNSMFNLTKKKLKEEEVQETPMGNLGKKIGSLIHKGQYKSALKDLKDVLKRKPKGRNLYYASRVAQSYKDVDAKLLTKMLVTEDYNEGVTTDGIGMAKIELANLEQDVEDLQEMFMNMQEEPEQWVLSKIAKATDYIESARDYLEFEGLNKSEDMEEGLEELELDPELEEEVEQIFQEMLEEEEFDQDFYDVLEEEKITGLVNKAEKSGISYSILKQVYNRGMAAWKTGHRPGASQQQWAFARVNSFITKGKGTWGGADKDLAAKARGSEKKESVELGTDASRVAYARETPGQNPDLVTAKYSADTVLNVLNDIRTQRAKKIYEEEEEITEAEYQGKKVKLNDPFRTSEGPKKFSVYTMGPKGKVVKVNFGDPNMEIKRDDPERRKSFRARHGCDTDPGPKWKAKYWSCRMWEKGKSVSELD